MTESRTVRDLRPGEETEVCALVRRVFDELVAPDFEAEGVAEFYRFADPEALAERAKAGNPVRVAEVRGDIVGMLEIKLPGHMAMLFVEKRGEGIGRQLVTDGLALCRRTTPHLAEVTVHASSFAVPIYRRLGFEPEGPERVENGIVFLPMAHAFDLRYPIGEFEAPSEVTSQQLGDWIAAIESLPERLRAAVDELTAKQLDTPYRPGGWTIRQVVHHLADSHLNSYIRFKWALTEERPVIKAYHEDRWAELADFRDTPIAVSLALLDALHVRWCTLLRALDSENLAREFVHPDSGAITLAVNIGVYAWHGRHHLAHIEHLKRRQGW